MKRGPLNSKTIPFAAALVVAEFVVDGRSQDPPRSDSRSFRLWAFGDAHVGTDAKRKVESLARAIRQSERGGGPDHPGAPSFTWDLAINVGDMSGGQKVPEDAEGREIVRQFRTLTKHRREQIYSVCGNHDRSGLDEPEAWWFRKWIDPLGENTKHSGVDPSRRPHAATGTWERYSFRVGNLLFLMMSDINEPTQTIGRGDLGGNPGGVVRGETFRWWKRMVETNRDAIIISAHHYMLKDTTVASGEWEGMKKNTKGRWVTDYHGHKPQGTPQGASYLYWVDSKPDAQAFERYLESRPGAIAMWIGGHTHHHPDDRKGGKSDLETQWGVHFVNVAQLTRWHGAHHSIPMSRVLTFTDGSNEVHVRRYMHSDEFGPMGWRNEPTQRLKLPRPFRK